MKNVKYKIHKPFYRPIDIDIQIGDKSRLELTYLGGPADVIQEHTLPGFKFKFIKKEKKSDDTNLSGNIGFSVIQRPSHGIWEHTYDVELEGDGINVGRMDLISVSNTPVYPSNVDEIKIESIVLREMGTVISPDDSIRITIDGDAQYDTNKKPQVINANLSRITSKELLITGYVTSDILVRDITLLSQDPISTDAHAQLIVDIIGTGYTQAQIVTEDILHNGIVDTLYFARSMETYLIPSHSLNLPGSLSKGDTLSIKLSGSIDIKAQLKLVKDLKTLGSFRYLFSQDVEDGYELIYERTKSGRKRLKLPEIILPSGLDVDYVEFSDLSHHETEGLSGSVTFYESNVIFKNTLFKNNISGDDFKVIIFQE